MRVCWEKMQSTTGPDGDGSKPSRACESCYRAKAKCIPQQGRESDKCSRCHRLQKTCIRPVQKPRKKRGPNVATTTAQLEKKIESLVTLLSSGRGPVNPIVEPRSDIHILVGDPPSAKPDISCLQDVATTCEEGACPGVMAEKCSPDPCLPTRYGMCGIAALTPAGSVASELDVREERAEKLLNLYRERFAIHLPVEFISSEETPQSLQSTRPWLFRTVMILASQDERSRQLEQAIQMARDFADAMLIRGEKSLDMLQAMLLYNTWSVHITPVNPQSTSAGFLQLAIAMVIDLGLNRPARQEECSATEIERWALNDSISNDLKRTLDERRAYLYCYLLTSTSSQCMKRIEGFNATPYLEYSMQVLMQSGETDMDHILAYSVKLQMVTECINRTVTECSDPQSNKAPIWMHMASTKTELQNIISSLPMSVRLADQLCLKYRSTEIFLYDSCIQKTLFSTASGSERLNMLYACLLAAQGFLDRMIELPESNFLGYSVINCAQIGHAISTLIRLSFVEEEGWNIANVRETINLNFYVNHFITGFERAGQAIDRMQQSPCKASFHTGCSRAMRRVLMAYNAKLAAQSGPEGAQSQQMQQAVYVPLDDPLLNISYEQFDDAYWEAIINDFSQA